jgi:uncharacterized lipoprotein YehR (DUF1307 family)
MNKILKKSIYLVSIVNVIILLTACSGSEPEIQTKKDTTTTSSIKTHYSNNEQKILEQGYPIDNYRFLFMNFQKKDPEIMANLFSNFDTIIERNFKKAKEDIDQNKKIDLIPSGAEYDLMNEKLGINYFLVNNSQETIESIKINGVSDFNQIKSSENVNISFSKDDFTTLKHNDFVGFSLTLDIPKENVEKIEQMKTSDWKVNVTELEINGKETDNNN